METFTVLYPPLQTGRLSTLFGILSVFILFFSINAESALSPQVRAEVEGRLALSRSLATVCPNGDFSSSQDGCNYGDRNFFAGLLCISGEAKRCDEVRRAQGPDGRWWRAEETVGHTQDVDAFSRDQSLGVMNYLIATKDQAAGRRWMEWVDANDGRLCGKTSDNRCKVTPDLWGLYGHVFEFIGLPKNGRMKVGNWFDDAVLVVSAKTAPIGFQLHLLGVSAMIRKAIGKDTAGIRRAVKILSNRQKQNPFFKFLDQGATDAVAKLAMNLCPVTLLSTRLDWEWQRTEEESKYFRSNGHDCVFIFNLLLQPERVGIK